MMRACKTALAGLLRRVCSKPLEGIVGLRFAVSVVVAAGVVPCVISAVPAWAAPLREPDRSACDEVAVIAPQFAAYSTEVRDRNMEEELHELNDGPSDYDQAMYLRQMLRWDANIFQRAALEAEDPVLHGKLLDTGNSVADVDDLIDDRIDTTSLGAAAPPELHDRFEDAMGIAQDAYRDLRRLCQMSGADPRR
jgi:hypothetical protein